MQILLLSFTFCCALAVASARSFKTAKDLEHYLQNTYEHNSNVRCGRLKTALWNYETDSNDADKDVIFRNIYTTQAQAIRKEWADRFKNLTTKQNWSEKIKRQIGIVKKIGINALDAADYKNLTNIINNLTATFQAVKLCPFNKKNCKKSEMLSLEPDLKKKMQESRHSEELLYIWTSWRDMIGSDVKKQFAQYVVLSNRAAKLNGVKDTGQMWRSEYETSSLYDDLNDLWDEIRPLYNEIHKYVLKKLRNIYKGQIDFDDGLIPAHILGDMWTQDWSHLYSILKPFPKSFSLNITRQLIDEEYHRIDMFRTANSFYTSIGLFTNEMAYDSDALIEKPIGRRVDCEAKTFDFCNGRQYRMKMCSNLTRADFLKIHAQLAEIQYFQQYKSQPYSFRTFANPAFAKAVGGAISLSASTPSYLAKIGLASDYKNTYGSAINRLMEMALTDVVSLPYNILADKWRWDVFSDGAKLKWNTQWWKYREYYQKVKPPIPRNNDKFDPGAQHYLAEEGLHSIDNFLATILQFQIYKALCVKSGQYNPKKKTPALNKCDFSQSREAGNVLRSGLSIGKSKHWKEVLKIITGQDDFDASALLEFFEPLYNYLRNSNDLQKQPSSTTKPSKKKKKKKQSKERSRDSLDFEEGNFEVDDEDVHNTTESDFATNFSKIGNESSTGVTNILKPPTSTALNNFSTSSSTENASVGTNFHEFLKTISWITDINNSTEGFHPTEGFTIEAVTEEYNSTEDTSEVIEEFSTDDQSTIETRGIEISTATGNVNSWTADKNNSTEGFHPTEGFTIEAVTEEYNSTEDTSEVIEEFSTDDQSRIETSGIEISTATGNVNSRTADKNNSTEGFHPTEGFTIEAVTEEYNSTEDTSEVIEEFSTDDQSTIETRGIEISTATGNVNSRTADKNNSTEGFHPTEGFTIEAVTEEYNSTEDTSAVIEEFSTDDQSRIETSGIEISTTTGNVNSSSTTEEMSPSSTEGGVKKYSIDFVYRGNLSTVLSLQVEVVTFAEIGRNVTTTFDISGGLLSLYTIDFRLSILLLIIIFV